MYRKTTKIRHKFFDILKGADLVKRRIPLMIAESENNGPVVWLIGCEHGDEVGGMVIIQEVFNIIEKQGLVRGSVHAIPLLNPLGFEVNSRQIPSTKEDLNRSYPGNPNGTLASRIAYKIHYLILKTKPDLVLDLHNDWTNSVPYILMEKEHNENNKSAYKKMNKVCRASGMLMIKDNDNLPNSLSTNLYRSNIPALTLELGQSFVVNEKNVKIGVEAILNILASFNMIVSDPYDLGYLPKNKICSKMLYYSEQPLSSTSGIIRFAVEAGDYVKKGQLIAEIFDTFGDKVETLKSKSKGIILGHNDSSVSFPGTSIVAMGADEEV